MVTIPRSSHPERIRENGPRALEGWELSEEEMQLALLLLLDANRDRLCTCHLETTASALAPEAFHLVV